MVYVTDSGLNYSVQDEMSLVLAGKVSFKVAKLKCLSILEKYPLRGQIKLELHSDRSPFRVCLIQISWWASLTFPFPWVLQFSRKNKRELSQLLLTGLAKDMRKMLNKTKYLVHTSWVLLYHDPFQHLSYSSFCHHVFWSPSLTMKEKKKSLSEVSFFV